MKRRFKGFKGLKLAILIASLLILVIIGVKVLHGGHGHDFGGGKRAVIAQHGQVFVIDRGHGFEMGQGRMFSRGEGREHGGMDGGELLGKIGWVLLIVGLVVFWLYRRVKRFSPRAAQVSPMLEMTPPTPTRNTDLLDEWENNINREENKHGDI
ncbi:hypothetical protein ACFPYJ_16495 [Paenibacillus solisilvae]|uniref:Uncharacterized protein n=1 Tax=Paenibacillus solisilvae TaxID=2486751 RepID=A0ABW0W2T4_9BACL